MLEVYWRVKSKNMKAIVFLEFGKMEFFVFENDAIYLSEMSTKRLKRFSKFLMVNFWYK
jgi:DNA mismatch repair ATPase MutS